MSLFGSTSTSAGGSNSVTDWTMAANYNLQAMRERNRFNRKQAQIRRDFEERMSSTAYQRAVKDLKEAGLNPVLAAQNGGARMASGNAAQANAASIGANSYGSAWNSRMSFDNTAQLVTDLFNYMLNNGTDPKSPFGKALVHTIEKGGEKTIDALNYTSEHINDHY